MSQVTQSRQKPQTSDKPKIRTLVGGGRFLWNISADGWNPKWGPQPYFGKVWADSEYWAVYEAYDRLSFPVNDTFKPLPTKVELR